MSTVRKSSPLLLQRLQQGTPVELIYTPHSRWPLPHPRITQQPPNRPLRISILDSSYNPPTLAHLALANSPRPSYRDDGEKNSEIQSACGYDAKLLLLSVKNADKSLKAGDATYQQRLEMMLLLSKDIKASTNTDASHSLSEYEAANVAIAIIDKPTFVGKSTALLDFLQQRLVTPLQLELIFIVGLDTLERLFSPRYYTSETDMMASLRQFLSAAPQGDNSRIVCARRVSSPAEAVHCTDFASLPLAKEFMESDRIVMIDIGDVVNSYSSSAIRSAIGRFGLGQPIDQLDGWKNMVTRDIADYIIEQRLYVG
ncbi:Nucleotidylyl transferase [Phlegmacium glaucopus]|nr:Nucleotidylyl transferase [Phlegmacium glaucopus]